MSNQPNMTNSRDLICNSVCIIEGDNLNDVSNLFKKLETKINSKLNVVYAYDKIAINAILENHYTQEQTTTLLNGKLDVSAINNYHNKTVTDAFFNVRYTKTETDTLLNLEANSTDVYTNFEPNNLLSAQ
jgi:hypothetical protein